MEKDYIHIILADDDEDDRLFFTDAFDELKINTVVNTFKNGKEENIKKDFPEVKKVNATNLSKNKNIYININNYFCTIVLI